MSNKAYPRTVFSETSTRIVNSPEEEKALGAGWHDHPADVKGAKADANGLVVAAPHDIRPVGVDTLPAPVKEGNTYHDRVVWQAQSLGIKIDKRWSDEQLLRKIAELQPLSREGIEEANKAVPDDQVLDYNPSLTPKEREIEEKVAAELKAKGSKAEKASK